MARQRSSSSSPRSRVATVSGPRRASAARTASGSRRIRWMSRTRALLLLLVGLAVGGLLGRSRRSGRARGPGGAGGGCRRGDKGGNAPNRLLLAVEHAWHLRRLVAGVGGHEHRHLL